MLSLYTPYDLQIELSQFVRKVRKNKKISIKSLSQKSGVPNSTIRKFESTGEISLRQFLMLYTELGDLSKMKMLTQMEDIPKSIDEVLAANIKL
ncbi:helix-turn-helix transcriptional regulator [Thalassotalea nanhaiensis]|uniref:Helix-turn-helix transcriptional regulator n=1 Tax=Thalassotalea nanhaiensis TaxID=3065648 RepID=A0ABY9TGU8_9GAMM|nr:helix-turn-helix transcriptional regulator [Colwelliaceae bacterium SQ345]